MKLIGIDPGLAHLGIVAWEDGRFVAGDVLRTKPDKAKPELESLLDRVRDQGRAIVDFMAIDPGQPTGVIMETYGHLQHASSAAKLAMSYACVATTFRRAPVIQLRPQEWRRLLGLSKGATKRDVQDAVTKLHPELPNMEPTQITIQEHFYDAAAIVAAFIRSEQGRFLMRTEKR